MLVLAQQYLLFLFATDVGVSIPISMEIGEGDGLVQVCATLSAIEATERNLSVRLMTINGTGRRKYTSLVLIV